MKKYNNVVLIILDGWGLSPSWGGNALVMNNPENINNLWRTYPHTILQALGAISYGNVVGESRLGHLMIGAGRQVLSFHREIGELIKSHQFYKNQQLRSAFAHAKKNHSNLHLIGMISNGGVHSCIDHLLALLEMARQENFSDVYIDAITDGVDTGPTESLNYIEQIKNKIKAVGIGQFSSIGGRDFAMDRDEHWDKVRQYYEAVTSDGGVIYEGPENAVSQNYRENKNDDVITPGKIKDKNGNLNYIQDNDAIIFYNYREDRAEEIIKIFVDKEFKRFLWKPKRINNLYFTSFTECLKNPNVHVAFPKIIYPNSLSEVVSKTGLRQLKIAESEKKTHVTAFINGGNDGPFAGEEVKIISSPRVASYDQAPQMSAAAITKTACSAIESGKYSLIVINFANVDMVAHTGNILAVGRAVQILDKCVNEIYEAIKKKNSALIITADHGNAEQMVSFKKNIGERETLHTLNPVPFILVTKDDKKNLLQTSISAPPNTLSKIIAAQDSLADVAPTVLELLGLAKPKEMTGHTLLNKME